MCNGVNYAGDGSSDGAYYSKCHKCRYVGIAASRERALAVDYHVSGKVLPVGAIRGNVFSPCRQRFYAVEKHTHSRGK